MLEAVYDLTDAESRLASALSAGHSIESAAAKLGIQMATARSQLKSVFRKTRVNRQQDLVRLITSLSLTPQIHTSPSAREGKATR
jgi:DNA-binding CsgD family transcriptional regulator